MVLAPRGRGGAIPVGITISALELPIEIHRDTIGS
jgi:hypothetical protein